VPARAGKTGRARERQRGERKRVERVERERERSTEFDSKYFKFLY
jgi:hypothetical protein